MTSEVLKYKPFVALATFPVGTITRIRFLKAKIKRNLTDKQAPNRNLISNHTLQAAGCRKKYPKCIFKLFLLSLQGTGGQHVAVWDSAAHRGQPATGGDLHLPRGGLQRVGTRRELAARQGGHAARVWVGSGPQFCLGVTRPIFCHSLESQLWCSHVPSSVTSRHKWCWNVGFGICI